VTPNADVTDVATVSQSMTGSIAVGEVHRRPSASTARDTYHMK
jgi:hypothetical protein